MRVMIVIGRSKLASIVAAFLKAKGLEVVLMDSPASAIECARSFRPDLVLTELLLSGMSGIEAAMRIRKIVPKCAILCLSGQIRRASVDNVGARIVSIVSQLFGACSEIFWLDLAQLTSPEQRRTINAMEKHKRIA